MQRSYTIRSEDELEAVIGPPMDVKAKILPRLDEVMMVG